MPKSPFDRLSKRQQECVRSYLMLDHDNEYNFLTSRECLDAYLCWEGIVGYTDKLLSIVTNLYLDEKGGNHEQNFQGKRHGHK